MFSRIRANNLFSWENLDYEIKPGISQITGFNYDDCTPEGCGKSSIPNILCWVLYGGVPKDVRIDDVIRQGCKSGHGEVVLDSGYRVVRSRKPNDVYIVKPSEDILKGKDAKETQLLINNLIGLDFDAFCQTIYFAQNYPKKFVAASDTEKGGILSQVLDLTIFDRGRKKAHDSHKQTEMALLTLQNDLIKVDLEANKLKSNAALIADFIERFEAEKAAKLESHEKNLSKAKNQVKTLTELTHPESRAEILKEIEDVQTKLENLTTQKVQCSTSIKLADNAVATRKRLEQTISFANSKIQKLQAKLDQFADTSKNCPTCGEPLKTHKVETVFEEVTEWKSDLEGEIAERDRAEVQLKNLPAPESADKNKRLLIQLENSTKTLNEKLRELRNDQAEFDRYVDLLAVAKASVVSLEKEISKTKASECSEQLIKLAEIDKEVTKLLEREHDLLQQKQALQARLSKLEILKVGFKEVKQFVFQTLLNELSTKSTRLAQDLFEVPINIRFSNEDEEGGVTKIVTTVTLDGNERALGLYSGGQYRRIELAVDLALASIVSSRSQNPLKFRVLDEPFKDLSEGSMEKVVKLLERLEGSTILIEHNSITKTIIHNIFDIEYRDGISRATQS